MAEIAQYPEPLRETYELALQVCTRCSFGSFAHNGGWRLTGSGSRSECLVVAMSPSSVWAPRFRPGHVLFGEDTTNVVNEGRLLEAFEELGFRRNEVFVTNLVKCASSDASLVWPRDKSEVTECAEAFLRVEIESLRPEVVVALGQPAWRFFGVHRAEYGVPIRIRRPLWPEVRVARLWHPRYLRYGDEKVREFRYRKYIGHLETALGPDLIARLRAATS